MNREKLREVFEKTHGFCWYCGLQLLPFGDWQVEHQHPRSRGGSDHIDNLVPACRRCNSQKGNRTVDEYRKSLYVSVVADINKALDTVFRFNELTGGFLAHERTPEFMDEPLLAVHDALIEGLSRVYGLEQVRFLFEKSPPAEQENPDVTSEGLS